MCPTWLRCWRSSCRRAPTPPLRWSCPRKCTSANSTRNRTAPTGNTTTSDDDEDDKRKNAHKAPPAARHCRRPLSSDSPASHRCQTESLSKGETQVNRRNFDRRQQQATHVRQLPCTSCTSSRNPIASWRLNIIYFFSQCQPTTPISATRSHRRSASSSSSRNCVAACLDD